MLKFIALVVSTLVLSGCSSEIVRPQTDAKCGMHCESKVVMNRIPSSPNYDVEATFNGEKVRVVGYQYIKNSVWPGQIITARKLDYVFYNDKLVSDQLDSTFDEDGTEFDVEKAKTVHKGQTKSEVVALLGKPSGNALYPIISDKEGSAIVYSYTYTRSIPLAPTTMKRLFVTFDKNEVVTEVSIKDKMLLTFYDVFLHQD